MWGGGGACDTLLILGVHLFNSRLKTIKIKHEISHQLASSVSSLVGDVQLYAAIRPRQAEHMSIDLPCSGQVYMQFEKKRRHFTWARAPEPWGKESDKGIQCLPPIPLQVGHVNKFDGLGLASSTRAIWIGRFLFLSAWTDGTVSFPDRSRRRTCHEKPWLHLFLSRRNSASSQWFDKGRWMTLRSRWNQQGASLPCMSDCLMLVENGKTGQISRLLICWVISEQSDNQSTVYRMWFE
jgi:hypothetical protein